MHVAWMRGGPGGPSSTWGSGTDGYFGGEHVMICVRRKAGKTIVAAMRSHDSASTYAAVPDRFTASIIGACVMWPTCKHHRSMCDVADLPVEDAESVARSVTSLCTR